MTIFQLPEPNPPEGDYLVRDQYIREYAMQAVRDALEDAALVAERGFRYAKDGDQIADAIRKMIGETK